jgi:hypothetical protein
MSTTVRPVSCGGDVDRGWRGEAADNVFGRRGGMGDNCPLWTGGRPGSATWQLAVGPSLGVPGLVDEDHLVGCDGGLEGRGAHHGHR